MKTTTLAQINQVDIQIIDDNASRLVPIKPICEALGIDEDAQRRKLKEDDFLNSTTVLSTAVGADGKDREMVCLPFQYIFGWLFTINPKNVKPEAKEAVAKYRILCYDALYRFFTEQVEFNEQKQQVISEKVSKMEDIRSEFNSAKDRLAEASCNSLSKLYLGSLKYICFFAASYSSLVVIRFQNCILVH